MDFRTHLQTAQDRFRDLALSSESDLDRTTTYTMHDAGWITYGNRENLLSGIRSRPAWVDEVPLTQSYDGETGEERQIEIWDTYWWRIVELTHTSFKGSMIVLPSVPMEHLEANQDFMSVFRINCRGLADIRKQEIWRQIARASGDCCRMLLEESPRSEGSASDSTEPRAARLTGSHKEILEAMRELGAVSMETRRSANRIAKTARGSSDRSQVSRDLAQLVEFGLVKSKTGSGGGSWLSETGKECLKSFLRPKKL